MADTIRTLAARLLGHPASAVKKELPRAQTAVLIEAARQEDARDGGRKMVLQAIRRELSRRGHKRRSAAGFSAPDALLWLASLTLAAVVLLLLTAPARADGLELRAGLYHDPERCTGGGVLARPEIQYEVWQMTPRVRFLASLEHTSCFGEADDGADAAGLVLEVDL